MPRNSTGVVFPLRFSSYPRASICLTSCRYPLLREVSLQCGLRVVDQHQTWDVLWSDRTVHLVTQSKLKRFQRTNHFPYIKELCHKQRLAENLNHMQSYFPEEYDFFPKTWILPRDADDVRDYLAAYSATLILKPSAGSNGAGICLKQTVRQRDLQTDLIAQTYIEYPFLIDGKKFDIRLYVLMTSCAPLRLYVHTEGIVRFATVKYKVPDASNLTNMNMHLTNYAVNKYSKSFIRDEEIGNKRRIGTVNQWFSRHGYSTHKIWGSIDDVIVKTVLSVAPTLKKQYNEVFPKHNLRAASFQLMGFDILLDTQLQPYVLEVNQSPSFRADSDLDREVKEKVLRDTFVICNLRSSVRKHVMREERQQAQEKWLKRSQRIASRTKEDTREARIGETKDDGGNSQWLWEEKHTGGFRLLHPCVESELYQRILAVEPRVEEVSYYKDTVLSRMRCMLTKTQTQKIAEKGKRNAEIQYKANQKRENGKQENQKIKSSLMEKSKNQKMSKTVQSQEKNKARNDLLIESKEREINMVQKWVDELEKNSRSMETKILPKTSHTSTGSPYKSVVSKRGSSKHLSEKTFDPNARKLLRQVREDLQTKLSENLQRQLREEMEFEKQWNQRSEWISTLGLEKIIYDLFKRMEILSARDIEKYGLWDRKCRNLKLGNVETNL